MEHIDAVRIKFLHCFFKISGSGVDGCGDFHVGVKVNIINGSE
jgi:hypothetical protein